jgi:hypothetical protein
MKNDDIEKLTTLLSSLQLQNKQLARDLQEAQDTIRDISAELEGSTKSQPTSRIDTKLIRKKKFEVGDKVLIKNPRGDQQDRGIIIDFTASGFAKIQTPNKRIVRRITYNLEHIE